MKQILKLICIAGIILLSSHLAYSQSKYSQVAVTDTFLLNYSNMYPLSSLNIVPFSEIVMLNRKVLRSGQFTISYSSMSIKLADSVKFSMLDTLTVTYSTIYTSLKKEYKRRNLVTKYQDNSADTIRIMQKEKTDLSPDAIFGRNIQKSGSIVRGFTVGTTRDFSLSSGLRLQLSGKIADDIDIVASLTDENTPIQPEGNTEKLDELDKVFIEIRHPNAVGTFGDFDLKERLGEFGAIDRKLQGLKGDLTLGTTNVTFAAAGSKGKFNNNQFTGLDGVQGPYRLSGANGEREIVIIAGSEKVYLNGEEMKRGERNDYTIDYSTAEVIFTPNRLITSLSRISVDFEYTDRRYSRNFWGTSFQSAQFDNRLKIKFNYFREGDNQDAPIDITFSDEEKRLLENAGSDRLAASRTGVSLARPDSTGQIRGTYSKADTVIGGKAVSYYTYTPGSGQYNITFSYIGEKQGDYTRESLGIFRFAGPGAGSYQPIILLPLPELKQTGNISFEYLPFNDLSMNVELAGSIFNKNRFSVQPQAGMNGSARNIIVQLKPREIKLGAIQLGSIGFRLRDRFLQSSYSPLDRIDEVEFGRNYNISAAGAPSNENLREAELTLIPVKQLSFNSSYGMLKRGENFRSDRFVGDIRYTGQDKISADYRMDYVGTDNLNYNAGWYRQNGGISYLIGKFRPSVRYQAEDKKERTGINDSLSTGSLKYYEIAPGFEILNFGSFNFGARYSFRKEYSPLQGILNSESYSSAQSYELSYRGIKEVSSSLALTVRDKKYTDVFKLAGRSDLQTILIRSQNRFSFWQNITGDFYYEGSTQRTARLQRVFVKVERGTGNYKYAGDLNGNGIADQNEFESTIYDGDFIALTLPTDELFPTIDLKVNTRWRLNFNGIFEKNSFFEKLFTALTSETVLRIEENSKETDYKKVYLLRTSSFLNEQTTIKGLQLFQQDLFLFENSSELSFRFRYSQSKDLSQFTEGIEKGYKRERSLRIKFRMIEEVSNQTDIINSTDNELAPAGSNRNRILSENGFATDFSYRPSANIESGLKITASRNEDYYPEKPTIINQNSQTLRLTLAFAESGRLRFEIERNELISNTTANYIPFEITKGSLLGKNYFWRLNLDYRIAGNLQSTVSYEGRVQGKGSVVNTARGELRAFF